MIRTVSLLVLCAALTPLLARPDDDPIRTKLVAAKVAYEATHSDYRLTAQAWFDARDDAARKAGNKKLVDLIKSERKAFEEKGDLPKGGPKNLHEMLNPARAALEAAYRVAVAGYTKARMDKEAEATEKELKEFLKTTTGTPSSAPSKTAVPKIAPALLKAKLAGKATYDDKTGVLTISYRFTDKKELKDFDLGDTTPTLLPAGFLMLQPGDSAKHLVQYDTLTMSATLGFKQTKGKVLSTSEDTEVTLSGDFYNAIQFTTKGVPLQNLTLNTRSRSGGNVRVGLIVSEKKATFQFASDQVGHEIGKPAAGHLSLHGGESGYAFGTLTITGKVNPDWAAAFFAE